MRAFTLPFEHRVPSVLGLVLSFAAVGTACREEPDPPAPAHSLTRSELMDPQNCAGCHRDHHEQWAASMHAYASKDPVFLAMNRRGQQETGGALGTFCVNCHAPMAVA